MRRPEPVRGGEGRPADLGAVAGLLRVGVAVEELGHGAMVDGGPGAELAIDVVLVRALAEPTPVDELPLELALHAEAGDDGQLVALRFDRGLDEDFPIGGDAVDECGGGLADGQIERGADDGLIVLGGGGDRPDGSRRFRRSATGRACGGIWHPCRCWSSGARS